MQDDDNFVQGVRWTGSGGFAAWDGTQIVNLGGAGAQVTWNDGRLRRQQPRPDLRLRDRQRHSRFPERGQPRQRRAHRQDQ